MDNIELLMQECNNYFYKTYEYDIFKIENGVISSEGMYNVGQYIKIEGSTLNNGVYKIESMAGNKINIKGLDNELFEGVIFGLAVPDNFINLMETINKHINTLPKNANEVSESFNNYSITVATGSKGQPLQWQTIFSENINPFRQIYDNRRRTKEVKKYSIITSLNGGVLLTDEAKAVEVVK